MSSDSPAVRIEKMTEADLSQVLAIESISFPVPFSENLFRMELRLSVAHVYVAKVGEVVAGYIDYWRVGPEIHLITIGVHPDWRKKQVGSLLVQFMLEEAKREEVDEVTLDVRPSNQAGLALYKRFGFQQVGLRKAYYQDNKEDALVFKLELK